MADMAAIDVLRFIITPNLQSKMLISASYNVYHRKRKSILDEFKRCRLDPLPPRYRALAAPALPRPAGSLGAVLSGHGN
jgi:hypothetical protein